MSEGLWSDELVTAILEGFLTADPLRPSSPRIAFMNKPCCSTRINNIKYGSTKRVQGHTSCEHFVAALMIWLGDWSVD